MRALSLSAASLSAAGLSNAAGLLAAFLSGCGSSAPSSAPAPIVAPTPMPAAIVALAQPSPGGPSDPRATSSDAREGPAVPAVARQGFVQIAVGLDVTCALMADHGVRCWGSNADGRAGLDGLDVASVPTLVSSLPPSRAIAVGSSHACAVERDGEPVGRVRCWGDNREGQLGDGTTASRAHPELVTGLDHVVELEASEHATCARIADAPESPGRVRCWGRAGFVGERVRRDQLVPIDVHGVRDAIDVVLGPDNGCALLSDHAARCWGFGGTGLFGSRPGPFERPTWAVRDAHDHDLALAGIALGSRHVCLHFADGHLECAGDDAYGQLLDQFVPDEAQCDRPSDGSDVTCTWEDPPPPHETYPPGVAPPDIWPPPVIPRATHTEHFASRRWYAFARSGVRAVVADGQFAMGRTCILTSTDEVACFGRHGLGDWGHRRESPMPLTRGATQLDVAPHHGCAVLADGRAVCWGSNHAGQLGDGTTEPRNDGVFVTW
ncbi:MAG: hypothetical protein K1X94_30420 [Sandaracinaceae bacterium]|nr:hypothetical protein [Sandaracinaceae bacterium]